MRPEDARYPAVDAAAGHYESFYLKVADAASRRALWLRYTVHKRPGAAPVGSLWATLFDADGEVRRRRSSRRRPSSSATAGATGCASARRASARTAAPARFPGSRRGTCASRAARRRSPTSRATGCTTRSCRARRRSACAPRSASSGEVTVRGRNVELDGWPGMVGHNWGAEHAERWIWLHGTAFGASSPAHGSTRRSAASRSGLGRRRGSRTAACRSTACATASAGSAGPARVQVERAARSARASTFPATGSSCTARSPPRASDVVGWIYSDPAGPQHHTAHCAIADMTLTVERAGRPPLTLAVEGRRDLRARHARARPRHPDPAVHGSVTARPRRRSAAPGIRTVGPIRSRRCEPAAPEREPG